MRNQLLGFCIYFLAVLALPFPAGAEEAGRLKRVLVLHSFHSILTPGYLEIDRGLKAGCRAVGGQPVEWDNEYLDLVRFGDTGYQDRWFSTSWPTVWRPPKT
jgi:hypothetical protein